MTSTGSLEGNYGYQFRTEKTLAKLTQGYSIGFS